MYPHHEESLKKMVDYFSGRDEILALVFGGSVAKGCERPDSDLDAMVIVTDEYYAQREKENRVTETISGYCTYEGGYFDVKYMTKAFIEAAADHASEPTRNSFIGSLHDALPIWASSPAFRFSKSRSARTRSFRSFPISG